MLDNILKYLGAGDAALTVMGPVLTIALAWLFGGALTQAVKFPLSRTIAGGWYDWTVRSFAVVATAGFAHILSASLPWPLEVGIGFAQPIAYKAGIAIIRRFWPWLEVSALIGSVTPSDRALQARAQRAADRNMDAGEGGHP
ncbi:MAG: hypothetical protein IT480_06410 [Gammaproteobacteria bacterium]|nr:hypothetical protein [Gammaproteobacteria bacterium]